MPPIPKPEGCHGCPFEHLSKYYVPDRMRNSPVLVLAQNPGEMEEQGARAVQRYYGKWQTEPCVPQPLVGPTGKWLRDEFWPRSQLGSLDSVSVANVIKCRPYGMNELPSLSTRDTSGHGITQPMLKGAIRHCMRAYYKPPAATRYVLTMGSLALYAMTGQHSLVSRRAHHGGWRGWALGRQTAIPWADGAHGGEPVAGLQEYYPCNWPVQIFATLHVAALFHNRTMYHATLRDFRRFGLLVRELWPAALPTIINQPPERILPVIGFDTEYTKEGQLEMWSLADTTGNVHVVDVREWGDRARLAIPPNLSVIAQNAQVDLPHFREVFGTEDFSLEDCMYADAVLWPGELHNLDYLCSKYARYNRHKHLLEQREHRTLYAGMDAHTTLNDVWRALCQQFQRDPDAYRFYVTLMQPLLAIIDRSKHHGIPVDQARVLEAHTRFTAQIEYLKERAQQLTGIADFNLASWQQVAEVLYSKGGTPDVTGTKRQPRSPTSVSRAGRP